MRRANLGKRDANEAEIVKALRLVGCDVVTGTDCDLFVGLPRKWDSYRLPQALLMEIKVPGQERALTALQRRLKEIYGSQYVVVSSVEQALSACGIAV